MPNYNYSIASDTANGAVAERELHNEILSSDITIAFNGLSITGDALTIDYKASLSAQEEIDLTAIISLHDGILKLEPEHVDAENYPINKNETIDGKVLYTKIHGKKATVPVNGSYRFQFSNPYTSCYFQGAEIMENVIGVNDFTIRHPAQVAADDSSDPDPNNHIYGGHIEQYGYSVNMGVIKYIRESKYAAKLPQGLVIECKVTNDTDADMEMGVNFILHDIREP